MAVRKMKESDSELYVAYQAGVVELPNGGGTYNWNEGDRLRADHPVVKHMGSSAFFPDGTPANEMPNMFEGLQAPQFERTAQDPRSLTLRYRCTKNVRVDVDGNVLTAKKGDVLEQWDDLVRIAPKSFKAVMVDA